MALSKRVRFEVLKRDGFKCKYCGITAMAGALEVDHVVPKSEGGADNAGNLVTACADCNRGKSNVSLEASQLDEDGSIERAREHAEQIRELLAYSQIVESEKNKVYEFLAAQWREHVREDPLQILYSRFGSLLERHTIPDIVDAMRITGAKGLYYSTEQTKYFYGVLRKKSENADQDN